MMELDSTLRLSATSLRESAEKILAIARSVITGNLFTVDRLAVRLWSTNKQIKALHFAETDIHVDVIGLEYISRVDGIAGLLQIVKTSDDNPVPHSVFRVWSSTLNVLCQISFEGLRFSCISFNPKQDTFFIIEKERQNVRLISLTSAQQQPQAPLFPKMHRNATDGSIAELQILSRWKCDVRVESNCAFERPDGFKTAVFYRTNAIIVLSERSLHLYAKKMDGDVVGIPYENSNTFPLSDLWTDETIAHPTCMQIYDSDKLIVGFRDGKIRVLLCVDDLNSERKPTILFDFQSNPDHLLPVTCFSIAPWSVNKEGLAFEVIALSGAHIVSHWRLQLHRKDYTPKSNRIEFHEKKKSQFLGYSHCLGQAVLGKDPQEKRRSILPVTRLVAYEHELDADFPDIVVMDDLGSRRKKMVITFDGLLLVFDVHEPHLTIAKTHQEAAQVAMNVTNGAYKFVMLHSDEIRLLSTPVRPNPRDATDAASGVELRGTGLPIVDSAIGFLTAVCFGGSGGESIYVGFSGGSVQCFGSADNFLVPARVALDTTTIHSTAIRKMMTVVAPRSLFIGQDPTDASAGRGSSEDDSRCLAILLIGDDKGILSMWRIGENSHKQNLLWAAHAHLGAIFYASSSHVSEKMPTTTDIIITGCNRGLVKCWILQPSGKLALSAFFNSSPSLSAIACLAVHDTRHQRCTSLFGRNPYGAGSGIQATRPSTVSYLCLCGDSFGTVESRLLSSDQGKASQRPVRTMHVCGASVSKMCLVASNVVDDRVQNCGERSIVLCASIDGSLCFLELDETGYFRRAGLYFSIPFSPLNILQYNGRMHIAGSHQIVEIRKFEFEPEEMSANNDVGMASQSGGLDVSALPRNDVGGRLGTFSESSGSRWEEETYPDNASVDGRHQSPGSHHIQIDDTATDGIIVRRRKLIADVSSVVPGVDIQSARKDFRLLELFKQYDSDGRHALVRADAVAVISKWLKVDMDFESTSNSEMRRILSYIRDPIFSDERVHFPELATLAAAAQTVYRRANLPSRRKLNYSSMMSYRRTVSYGVMGETQETRRQLVHGNPQGRSATFSHVAYRVLGRELFETIAIAEAAEPPILLSGIPPNLKAHIGKTELPASWSPRNKYYLDVRRTVRIVRTVFDIRGAVTAALDEGFISNQVVEYFQTNYGAASLDVAGDKILNFLEALLQYTNVPVVNSFRKLIFEEEVGGEELFPNKMALSYYLRTRTFLYSGGYVVPGEFLPRDGSVGSFDDPEPAFGDTFAVPRRQLVLRLHVFECMRSLFESANFGPSAVQRLFALVQLLPNVEVATANKSANAVSNDYIDCENFLDVVLVEIERVIAMIDDLKQIALAGNQFDLSLLKLPSNQPMPDAAFLQQIVHTNGLVHRLILVDPERTGRVNVRLFREEVLHISRPVDGSHRAVLSFVDECRSRFRCGRVGDEVSYLDLWATLLSYLVQKDDLTGGAIADHAGYVETNFPIWAHAALLGLKRGLDEDRASALVALLGYMQSESNDDGLTTPSTRDLSTGRTDRELHLDLRVPQKGFWMLPTVSELAFDDPGGMYVTAAKIVMTSSSSTAVHTDAADDPAAAKRKPTMSDLLRPTSKHTSKVLRDGGTAPEMAHHQAKVDLHPVVLTAPLIAAQAEGKLIEQVPMGRVATYAKSYSRSVNSLNSGLIGLIHEYRRNDVEVSTGERSEVESSSSGLRVTTMADIADNTTAKGRQESMTCNEIEQLRIAQLVRQHDVLNKIEHEQELLRRRREKRNIDAQLLTKRDRRQPKKRKPLTVYTEPSERVKETPRRVTIAISKREKVEHRGAQPVVTAVVPPPQPATAGIGPSAPVSLAKLPIAAVTKSADMSPKLAQISKPLPVQQPRTSRSPSRASTPAVMVAPVSTAPDSSPISSWLASNNGDDGVDDATVDVDAGSCAASRGDDAAEHPDEDDDDDEDYDDGVQDVDVNGIDVDKDNVHDEGSVDSVAPSSLGHPVAVLRVEAPLVSPSPVPALVTPRVEREEELNREEFECAQMGRNDFDSPFKHTIALAVAGASIKDGPPEEEYHSSSDESAISDEEQLSYAEKRIRILKQKLEEAKRGYHPRRNDEEMAGIAFFPMLFSDDLVYNPCASSCGPLVLSKHGTDGSNAQTARSHDESPRATEDGFSDICRVVDERKAKLQRERLLQLYKNSSTAITDEWVSVVRRKGIDWETFMSREKGSRVQQTLSGSRKTRSRPKAGSSLRPITSVNQLQSDGPLPGFHVSAALAAIAAMNAADHDASMVSKDDPGAVANAEEDDFYRNRIENHEKRLRKPAVDADGNEEQLPIPVALPFGNVVSGICEIDMATYYYVQVTTPDSVVTIELHCTYGFADIYSSSNSIPTAVHFEHRAVCTLENAKLCRITTKASGDHVCVLVHSRSTGAAFTLWAYETGKMSIEVPEVKRTGKFVKAFNRLIENDDDNLGTYLPRLLYEAHQNVQLQDEKDLADTAVFRRHHINANVGRDSARRGGSSGTSARESVIGNDGPDSADQLLFPSSLLDEDGEDIVERYIYRKSISLLRGDPTINPNVDAKLMLPCLLPRKILPTGTAVPSEPIKFPKVQEKNTEELKATLRKLGGTPKKLIYKLASTKTNKDHTLA